MAGIESVFIRVNPWFRIHAGKPTTTDSLTGLLCSILSRRLMHLDGTSSIVTHDVRPTSFDAAFSAAIKVIAAPALAHLILWVSGERGARE
jgi:hypothetical protein